MYNSMKCPIHVQQGFHIGKGETLVAPLNSETWLRRVSAPLRSVYEIFSKFSKS